MSYIVHTPNWDVIVENGQFTVAIPLDPQKDSIDLTQPGHEDVHFEANVVILEELFSDVE